MNTVMKLLRGNKYEQANQLFKKRISLYQQIKNKPIKPVLKKQMQQNSMIINYNINFYSAIARIQTEYMYHAHHSYFQHICFIYLPQV